MFSLSISEGMAGIVGAKSWEVVTGLEYLTCLWLQMLPCVLKIIRS